MCACLQLYDRAEYAGGNSRTWKSRKHIKHDDTQLVMDYVSPGGGEKKWYHVIERN
jgi:hypothetical protein